MNLDTLIDAHCMLRSFRKIEDTGKDSLPQQRLANAVLEFAVVCANEAMFIAREPKLTQENSAYAKEYLQYHFSDLLRSFNEDGRASDRAGTGEPGAQDCGYRDGGKSQPPIQHLSRPPKFSVLRTPVPLHPRSGSSVHSTDPSPPSTPLVTPTDPQAPPHAKLDDISVLSYIGWSPNEARFAHQARLPVWRLVPDIPTALDSTPSPDSVHYPEDHGLREVFSTSQDVSPAEVPACYYPDDDDGSQITTDL
ncbi:uncharacterized protein BXZ73DRAFT_106271 [Epithele typhae]|uniref:uncharacterized protein n=1 Tax=Epithele typhae TaxID=378194 RepID=UPI0020081809|nr:uncharacterized protein BXZ73DRAFT_106271 [Epithele typhae]KAH9915300.1 hypothetical protein BXZ73DRAFT_106271 [Epithele typhae]